LWHGQCYRRGVLIYISQDLMKRKEKRTVMKLMLIDDQMPILTSLKEALEPGGYECVLFDQPQTALIRFDNEHYDVVITDLKMPKIDGIEVLKHVQKSKPGTPVIILTGYADTENAIQAVNYGAYAFYQKPIKIHEFIKVLNELDEQLHAPDDSQSMIKRLVDERTTLLAEVNHRVKNNLQVINSLLRIQFRTASSREAADALLNANNRIHAMALIHDSLYAVDDVAAVRLHEYIPVLARQLHRAVAAGAAVDFGFDLSAVTLPLDQAIPVGIILNELISNALKHCPQSDLGKQLKIRISLARDDRNQIKLSVSDNGAGLPSGFKIDSLETVGLAVVHILVNEQLEGQLTHSSGDGTHFEVRFSEVPLT